MATYAVLINDDGAGNFGAQAFRAPATLPVSAAATNGVLPIPWIDNNNFPYSNIAITGATNATPIVLTVPSGHGIVNGDVVFVRGVGGNLAANGTFYAASVGATNVTLQGSAGSGAYTSGGFIRREDRTTSLGGALEAAKRAILNDRSTNG